MTIHLRFSTWVAACLGLLAFSSAIDAAAQGPSSGNPPHIVFVSNEEEYKSKNTLPELAKELESKYGVKTTVLIGKSLKDLPGLEALEKADLAVFYVRFQVLPPEQLQRILDYVNSGKPVVGLRTSTHSFLYPKGSPYGKWNDQFGRDVFGTPWKYHFGHSSSTDVRVNPEHADHPILKGVDKEFHCRSWLYYVIPLPAGVTPLLIGKSVGPGRDKPEQRPENPVAWTYSHAGGRVFFTTLGHPEDFQVKAFRRLLTNGIFWALGRETPTAASEPSK